MIQQFLAIVPLIFSSVVNVHGNGRIEQQNLGIPDVISPPSESESSSSSSSSQYITQQNIGIPDGLGYQPMPSSGSSSSLSSSSSSSSSIGFLPQQNIGKPDIPATGGSQPSSYEAFSSSSLSCYGSPQGSGFMPQLNIGIPGRYPSSNRQVITLPVHSRHTIEYVDVPSTGNIQPINIQVPAPRLGANFNFRSSSNIKVSQSHQNSPGGYHQETSSIDEPIRLSMTVRRPVVHELRETIQPYRKVYEMNSDATLGGTRPQQQQQKQPQSGRKGNRRFYDGSYGIGQQKI
ncbi:uncharacterized protein LOC124500159 [Dermatophagoides farinae]|uniref:uncharacterized protein LOC124500159 n=1 Tax=Dermatophagoides farinae TaxID=6954 RepID=UPI003F5DE024